MHQRKTVFCNARNSERGCHFSKVSRDVYHMAELRVLGNIAAAILLRYHTMKIILPQKSYTYPEYIAMVEALQHDGKVTGHQQSESLLVYSKLNMHRMHRWEKTFVPSPALARKIAAIDKPLHWVVITEGWCGDAAQQLPVIEKLASLNPLITTHYVLRDENPEFMDLFLTNGARSIPVWICTDEHWNFRWKWGARPRAAQDMLNKLKEEAVSLDEQKQQLHGWYAKNKHEALQLEVAQMLDS
jgi:hypothetical protein